MNRRIWWGVIPLFAVAVAWNNVTLPVTAREWKHALHRPIDSVSDQIARQSHWYMQALKDYDRCLADHDSCDQHALQARLDMLANSAWAAVLPQLNEVPWSNDGRSLIEQDIYTVALARHEGDLSACTLKFTYGQGAGPSIEHRLSEISCRHPKSNMRAL